MTFVGKNYIRQLTFSNSASTPGMSNLFLQRASIKFKNVVRAAFKKHDELKLYLY
jgi:hypothetical protein